VTPPANTDITRQKLTSLLESARRNRPVADKNANAPQFDFNQARHFNRAQMQMMAEPAKKLAAAFEKDIRTFGRADRIIISSEPVGQVTTAQLSGQMSDMQFYCNMLNATAVCGYIVIQSQDAGVLLGTLLGDTDVKDATGCAFSPLEESLLQDIFKSVSANAQNIFKERNGPDIRGGGEATKGKPDLDGFKHEEFCQFAIAVKAGQADIKIRLSIKSSLLDTVVGANVSGPVIKKDELQKTMLGHIGPATIGINTRLTATTLTFQEILSLTPNDILIFDQLINDPVEIMIGSKNGFSGKLAANQNRYAVVINGLIQKA
jgi:flagellar motor switch protein FliM